MGVESELGKGSTFWFTLRLKGTEKQAEARVTTSGTIDLSSARILVAEDNRTNQIVIQRYLEKRGCRPRVVDDGSKVLHENAEAVAPDQAREERSTATASDG